MANLLVEHLTLNNQDNGDIDRILRVLFIHRHPSFHPKTNIISNNSTIHIEKFSNTNMKIFQFYEINIIDYQIIETYYDRHKLNERVQTMENV